MATAISSGRSIDAIFARLCAALELNDALAFTAPIAAIAAGSMEKPTGKRR